MQSIPKDFIFYHGSYCEVLKPDLTKCSRFKDFGKGFYLTSSFEQAKKFAILTTHKAIENKQIPSTQKTSYVSVFKFLGSQELKIHKFETANIDWLHCIVAHRKKNSFADLLSTFSNYDIILGKIANDNTNATITAYMASTFGEIGSNQADNICISLLLPERLENQFCFRSEKSLLELEYLRSEKICL